MTTVNSYLKISGYPVLQPDALSMEARKHRASDAKWRGRANSVTISGGMEPASSYVLVSAEVMSRLDVNAPQTLQLYCVPNDGSTAPIDALDFHDAIQHQDASIPSLPLDAIGDASYSGLDRFMLTSQYIYRAESVLAGDVKVKGPYLLELKDIRHIYTMSGTNRTFNLLTPTEQSYWSSSINSGTPWSWKEIVNELIQDVPFLESIDSSLSTFPTHIAENYRFDGQSAWNAIGKILQDTQQLMLPRMPFFPIPDGFPTATQASQQPTWMITNPNYTHEPNEQRRADFTDKSYCPQITTSRVPVVYLVCFPDRDYAYQTKNDSELYDSYDAQLESPVYTVSHSITGGLPGTRMVIHDTLPVRRDVDTGAVMNQGDLNTRAQQLAQDYHARLIDADQDNVYSGLHQFMPDGNVHAVTWFDFGKGWQTRVEHGPRSLMRDYPHHTYPDISEQHIPVHRKIYGKVTSTSNVQPTKTGNAETQYLDIQGNWQETSPKKPFVFRNVGLTDIQKDDMIYAEWWWQRKEWVAWCGFRA